MSGLAPKRAPRLGTPIRTPGGPHTEYAPPRPGPVPNPLAHRAWSGHPLFPSRPAGASAMAQPATNHEPIPAPPGSNRPPLRVHEGGAASATETRRQPPTLPEPGTRVVLALGKHDPCRGEVMPYEQQWSHGSFPVRFEHGRWHLMTAADLYLDETP
jgi:hypothetical protein